MSEEMMVPNQHQLDLEAVHRAVTLAVPIAVPGHIFTHTWLAEALGLLPLPESYTAGKKWDLHKFALIDLWSDALLAEHHIVVANRWAQGYEVVAPKDVERVVTARVKRESRKTFRQGYDTLVMASAEGLTDNDIADRHKKMAWIGTLSMMLEGQRKRPPKMPRPLRAVESDPNPRQEDSQDFSEE